MPRNIPISFREAAEQSYNEEVDLCFVTITHQQLIDPIRVVWDTKDYVFNGNTFIGFPFDITILTDDDQPPKAQLTIQNVDRAIGEAIQNLRSPPRIRIELLSSTDFFTLSEPRVASRQVFLETFESGTGAGLGGSSLGSVSFDSAIVKVGNLSMKFPVAGQPAYRETTTGKNIKHAVMQFDFYMGRLSSEALTKFAGTRNSADTAIVDLYVGSNGALTVKLNNVTIGTATDFKLNPARWYRFAIRQYTHATLGEVQITVNDSTVFFMDGLNTAFAGNVDRGLFGFVGTIGVADVWFDQVELLNLDQRKYYTGFETGNKSELGGTSRAVSIVDTDFVPNGTYALKFSSEIGGAIGFFTGGANSITNPINATGSFPVKVGDLIIAVIGEQTALTVTGVTDNLGNTYTAQNAGTDAGTVSGRMFYAYVTVAGTLTTVSFAATASADDVSCCVAGFRGPFDTSPLDKTATNRTNDTTNPLQTNSLAAPTFDRALQIGWFAGANGTAGIVPAADAADLIISQRQSANIETVISALIVPNHTSQVLGYSTPGTIGNNVIGTASFKGSDPNPYVESTTGFNLNVAILRFKVSWGGNFVFDDLTGLGSFRNSSDTDLIQVVVSPALQIGLYVLATDTYHFNETEGLFSAERTHLIELRFIPDNSGNGAAILMLDGTLVVFASGLSTGTGNIDRAALQPSLTGDGVTFVYDEFEVISLDDMEPEVIYSADNLYLQNVKVDALQITADIVGWDFLQRVWPAARADKATFPGLFR